MTKSTIDLNNNSEREDLSIGNKYIILKENIEFIEQIGEGRFSKGNSKLQINFTFFFSSVFKASYRNKQNELVSKIKRRTSIYSIFF